MKLTLVLLLGLSFIPGGFGFPNLTEEQRKEVDDAKRKGIDQYSLKSFSVNLLDILIAIQEKNDDFIRNMDIIKSDLFASLESVEKAKNESSESVEEARKKVVKAVEGAQEELRKFASLQYSSLTYVAGRAGDRSSIIPYWKATDYAILSDLFSDVQEHCSQACIFLKDTEKETNALFERIKKSFEAGQIDEVKTCLENMKMKTYLTKVDTKTQKAIDATNRSIGLTKYYIRNGVRYVLRRSPPHPSVRILGLSFDSREYKFPDLTDDEIEERNNMIHDKFDDFESQAHNEYLLKPFFEYLLDILNTIQEKNNDFFKKMNGVVPDSFVTLEAVEETQKELHRLASLQYASLIAAAGWARDRLHTIQSRKRTKLATIRQRLSDVEDHCRYACIFLEYTAKETNAVFERIKKSFESGQIDEVKACLENMKRITYLTKVDTKTQKAIDSTNELIQESTPSLTQSIKECLERENGNFYTMTDDKKNEENKINEMLHNNHLLKPFSVNLLTVLDSIYFKIEDLKSNTRKTLSEVKNDPRFEPLHEAQQKLRRLASLQLFRLSVVVRCIVEQLSAEYNSNDTLFPVEKNTSNLQDPLLELETQPSHTENKKMALLTFIRIKCEEAKEDLKSLEARTYSDIELIKERFLAGEIREVQTYLDEMENGEVISSFSKINTPKFSEILTKIHEAISETHQFNKKSPKIKLMKLIKRMI